MEQGLNRITKASHSLLQTYRYCPKGIALKPCLQTQERLILKVQTKIDTLNRTSTDRVVCLANVVIAFLFLHLL